MNMESNIDLEDNVKQENIEDSNNENLETEEETQEN